MSTKKKVQRKEYDFLGIALSGFDILVEGSINHEVRIPRYYREDARVYNYSTQLQLTGTSIFPDEHINESYFIVVHGSEDVSTKFDTVLSDYHVPDESQSPVYRKVRGELKPVYDPPSGIGLLERERGTKDWSGWCWLPASIVSDMVVLLNQRKPLYISIHEMKQGRARWIVGLTLQTIDPAEG